MQQPFHLIETVAIFVLMATTEVFGILAQAATSPAAADVLLPLLQSFGIPGAWLAVIAYTTRKIVLWGQPHVANIIAAHIARQETMAECQKKLTEETIQIQRKNHEALLRIEGNMPLVCQGKPKT